MPESSGATERSKGILVEIQSVAPPSVVSDFVWVKMAPPNDGMELTANVGSEPKQRGISIGIPIVTATPHGGPWLGQPYPKAGRRTELFLIGIELQRKGRMESPGTRPGTAQNFNLNPDSKRKARGL